MTPATWSASNVTPCARRMRAGSSFVGRVIQAYTSVIGRRSSAAAYSRPASRSSPAGVK